MCQQCRWMNKLAKSSAIVCVLSTGICVRSRLRDFVVATDIPYVYYIYVRNDVGCVFGCASGGRLTPDGRRRPCSPSTH